MPFRREPDEFLEIVAKRKPGAFDPPDVSQIQPWYPRQFEEMALARGRWWRKNRLPMVEAERNWLAAHE